MDDGEGSPASPGPDAYWRLKGALQVEFARNLQTALERTEDRIISRIDAAELAARRAEDLARQGRDDVERRLRATEQVALAAKAMERRLRTMEASNRGLESGLEAARAQARLLMWMVPVGFGAITLAMGVIQFLRGPFVPHGP